MNTGKISEGVFGGRGRVNGTTRERGGGRGTDWLGAGVVPAAARIEALAAADHPTFATAGDPLPRDHRLGPHVRACTHRCDRLPSLSRRGRIRVARAFPLLAALNAHSRRGFRPTVLIWSNKLRWRECRAAS
jgi:hypothetical protein